MTAKVKICGLMTKADIDVAVDNGADYIGLAFFEPSPRNLTISDARSLADHARGRTQIVALTVDADDTLIKAIASDVAPDILQLHGSEDHGRIRQLAALSGCQMLKVIKVQTAADAHIGGTWRGAMTWGLTKAIKESNGDLTYDELITRTAANLKDYDQRPQLECPNALRTHKFLAPLA